MQQDFRSSTHTISIDRAARRPVPAAALSRDACRAGNSGCRYHRYSAGVGPTAEPTSAGQFNMLYVFGVGEIAISVSGDPADESRFVHTIRDVGKASSALTRLK